MPKTAYRLYEGSLQHRFQLSRAKVQMYGGGFANGKTTSACIKAIQVAKDYPGANILLARSTFPKLNDTLRKEFFKWLPEHWIKSFSKSDNTLVLTNGTTVNFRYVAQQGKNAESTTSNLLSATYDLIVVDQMEDPEISEKDFDDLLGRLRGMARYEGNDETMPHTGPRWIVLTCNPTRNWVYRKLVKPLHDHKRGVMNDDLLVDTETGEPLIELFEGSTYENKDNLEGDFIRTLESAYRGQMRDRFLLGEWAAYEGLVYPQFDETVHVLLHEQIIDYLQELRDFRYTVEFIEAYDYGLAVPSCYLLAFADNHGNIFVLDGFYGEELSIEHMSTEIKKIRRMYDVVPQHHIFADPSIFRRSAGDKKTVGVSVAGLFQGEQIMMQRGNNDIINGITKIQGYLIQQEFHRHPLYGTTPAPYLYISDNVPFLRNEFNEYYWKKDTQGDEVDRPNDKNDHAMDTLKYLLSRRARVSKMLNGPKNAIPPHMRWQEYNDAKKTNQHRYA